jgi:peptidoglycan hydrolase CwlO-like protein
MRMLFLGTRPRTARRWAVLSFAGLLAGLCALVALAGSAPAQDAATELNQVHQKQGALSTQIERQNKQVNDLIGEVSALQEREAAAQEELDAKQAELEEATAELEAERQHLREVRARLKRARAVLKERLIEIYKSGAPDVLTVILSSASWSDVMAESEYLDQIQGNDEAIVSRVRTLRDETKATVERLTAAREQIESARDAIAAQRDQLASSRASIEAQRDRLVAARDARKRTLASLSKREKGLQDEVSEQSTTPAPSAPVAAPKGQAQLGADGQAIPPANAPPAVRGVIEAANRIATKPYVWGGGHGSFESSGYDCSGAVSYALHGGGFLSSPLDSTGLMTWGEPGSGPWITVYASSGHAYAVIAGLRWDTSGNASGSGPRWSTSMRSSAGYVARHPAGY